MDAYNEKHNAWKKWLYFFVGIINAVLIIPLIQDFFYWVINWSKKNVLNIIENGNKVEFYFTGSLYLLGILLTLLVYLGVSFYLLYFPKWNKLHGALSFVFSAVKWGITFIPFGVFKGDWIVRGFILFWSCFIAFAIFTNNNNKINNGL